MNISTTNKDTDREVPITRKAAKNYWWTSIIIIINVYSESDVSESHKFGNNHPFIIRTKNCVEVNVSEKYNRNSQIKFKTTTLKWRLCDNVKVTPLWQCWSDAFVTMLKWRLCDNVKVTPLWQQWFINNCERNHKNYWSRSKCSSYKWGKRSKQATFKSCAPFTDCISGINNALVDIAKNLDVVILMYNLTECSNN